MEKHRVQLEKLSLKDPEFYEFLKEQDADLLEFDESDIEVDQVKSNLGDDAECEESKDEFEIGGHFVTLKIDNKGCMIVNQKLIDTLEELFQDSKTKRVTKCQAVRVAIQLFEACNAKVKTKSEVLDFVVMSDEVFDGIVRLCLEHVGRCLLMLINPTKSKQRKIVKNNAMKTSFKFWKKYRGLAKLYLYTLFKFMKEISQREALIACIQSIPDLADLLVHFPKICRHVIKLLVKLWSQRSIDERRSAFAALKRLCQSDSKKFEVIYKKCYIAYVSVSRNVSANSWINLLFMQKTFSELTFLNPTVAYQYAFSYIRQLAIHLRNAKIAKRKDVIKTVYNWQYVCSLYLWASVLTFGQKHRDGSEAVESIYELLYSLIQVTIGLIGVFAASRYVPLRLHCVRVLLLLQVKCDTFIPTLSLAADCLNDLARIDQKKPSHTKVLQKSTGIKNLIRLTNEMLEDTNYRRQVAEEIFKLLSDAAQIIRNEPAFFEIYVPVRVTLKNFLRECRNVEHKTMLKGFEKAIQVDNYPDE